jgi:hypothetical protein
MKNTSLAKFILVATIAIGLVAGLSRPANATQTGTSVKVVQINVYNAGALDVLFSGDICNDSGAARTWGQASIGTAGTTADGLKSMLSEFTAAKLSGRSVVVRTSGYAWGCKIVGVELY